MLRTYRAPRSVVRAVLAEGRRDDRALVWLMGACALAFVAQWPRLAFEARTGGEVPLAGLMAGALFGWLFVAPLLFHGVAAILQLGLRVLGARSAPWAVRHVTFWTLLAASPLWLAQGLVWSFAGAAPVTTATGLGAVAVWIAMLGAGLREAVLEPPAASP